jgi:orotate phosphoribosyltransferase
LGPRGKIAQFFHACLNRNKKTQNIRKRTNGILAFLLITSPLMSFITVNQPTARLVARHLLQIGAICINYRQPFTWSSGWKSPIYCDNRLALSYPAVRSLIKTQLATVLKQHFGRAACVAGVATAGVPQGALVADQLGLPFIYVRPKPKEHGMGNLIEGKITPGQPAVLIEDLISTGGSSLKAAGALRDAGFDVLGMAAIFTYGFDTAEKNFSDARVPLVCLSDFHHLLQAAVELKMVSENDLIYIKSWRLDPANWK